MQANRYRKEFPDVFYYQIELAKLGTMEGVRKMLDYFGCIELPGLDAVVGRPTNRKLRTVIDREAEVRDG